MKYICPDKTEKCPPGCFHKEPHNKISGCDAECFVDDKIQTTKPCIKYDFIPEELFKL